MTKHPKNMITQIDMKHIIFNEIYEAAQKYGQVVSHGFAEYLADIIAEKFIVSTVDCNQKVPSEMWDRSRIEIENRTHVYRSRYFADFILENGLGTITRTTQNEFSARLTHIKDTIQIVTFNNGSPK